MRSGGDAGRSFVNGLFIADGINMGRAVLFRRLRSRLQVFGPCMAPRPGTRNTAHGCSRRARGRTQARDHQGNRDTSAPIGAAIVRTVSWPAQAACAGHPRLSFKTKPLPSGTFQRDTQKEKCPSQGHFILAATYLCCFSTGGRIVILDGFLDPRGCLFQIFQVHGRMEFDLRIERKEPGLGHGWNL